VLRSHRKPRRHAAEDLNLRKVAAPRGGQWQATQIIRARKRLGLAPAAQ
jgi:hypothetical protein